MPKTHTGYCIAHRNNLGKFELQMNDDVVIENHEKDAIKELKKSAERYGINNVMLLSVVPVSFKLAAELKDIQVTDD